MNIENALTVLYYALMGFITINVCLSFFLWRYSKNPIYAKTLAFWLFNYINLGMQFFYPANENEVVLVYGLGNISTIIAYSIYCELVHLKVKYTPFITSGLVALVLTLLLLPTDVHFTLKSLPFATSVAIPLLYVNKNIFFNSHRRASLLEKFLGFIFSLWVIHSFNFAFFRMQPNAPMYGWMTTYALFDMLAIILPAISIEEHLRTEKKRLQELVAEKTEELSVALNDKEHLLKILIHDISNPLNVMRWYLLSAKKEHNYKEETINKIIYSQEIVENIVKKVKVLQYDSHNQVFQKVSITHCIEEMRFLFQKQLEDKKLSFEIEDLTKGDCFIIADQFSFTHNVLSNFVSNAIKYSFNESKIVFSIKNTDGRLQLVIRDYGQGMSKETIQSLLTHSNTISSLGTNGEKGTGLGIGIAKAILKSIKADFDIQSNEFCEDQSLDHGTIITLTF